MEGLIDESAKRKKVCLSHAFIDKLGGNKTPAETGMTNWVNGGFVVSKVKKRNETVR